MIKSGIYAILNLVNGKRYIGSAVNLEGRRQDHFRKLRKGIHGNSHLQNAFNKYGDDAFGWMALEYVEDTQMLKPRENIYLGMFWPSGLLYNVCPVAGSTLGYKFTEEQCHRRKQEGMYGKHHTAESKRKSSEAHKGKYPNAETRRKLSLATTGERNPFYGKRHTAETKRKMKETHIGKPSGFKGKCHTAEAKQKNSESHKGKRDSAETRRKKSEAKKGKPLNEEHRHNISVALKKYWARKRAEDSGGLFE